MARVTIRFQETTPQQRRKMLRDLAVRLEEHESLDELIGMLSEFEEQYGMSTVEFYARFVAGKMGDSRDFMKWAGAFQSYTQVMHLHLQRNVQVA